MRLPGGGAEHRASADLAAEMDEYLSRLEAELDEDDH